MQVSDRQFITGGEYIYYPAIIRDISKSRKSLQPIYEAFTNALESLDTVSAEKKITISIHKKTLLEDDDIEFSKIVLEDNGDGFNDDNFERFCRFKDTRKGFNNRGCGRIQYLHFFKETEFLSFYDSEGKYRKRNFILSKKETYLENNAIVYHIKTEDISESEQFARRTELSFNEPVNKKDFEFYNKLTAIQLKSLIIKQYMGYLCTHRNCLPIIEIIEFRDNEETEHLTIIADDIPAKDKKDSFEVNYIESLNSNSNIEYSNEAVEFSLTSYKIPKEKATGNEVFFTSKGELAQELNINFLSDSHHIEGYKYLFLLSSDYIDKLDSDTRGEFKIKTYDDFKKELPDLFDENNPKEIALEDIQENIGKSISVNYPEIQKKQEEQQEDINKLKKMFLLDDESLAKVKLTINDSEENILKKVYKYDADVIAKKDAEIKRQIDSLNSLDPNDEDYQEKLTEQIEELVTKIPIQNRTALTHYVARRKLVLDLFDRIISHEVKVKTNGEINESLLHNILFTQHSDSADESDLWVINEDFIYFNGYSDTPLSEIKIDGTKLLKESFTKEEERYLSSLGENRKIKRPDVLLFPKEGKCIILEFKKHDVNVAGHLNQINKYAYLILNFCDDQFQLNTFYGYLIGEAIEPRDVRAADSDFIEDYHFDYLVRPTKKVVGDNKNDGSLYMEVVKYSTLLKRAQLRNKIYIDKLTKNLKDDLGDCRE